MVQKIKTNGTNNSRDKTRNDRRVYGRETASHYTTIFLRWFFALSSSLLSQKHVSIDNQSFRIERYCFGK